MDAASQNKVIDSGFSIIRCEDNPSVRIKAKTYTRREWHTIGKYTTKAERDRDFKKMLEQHDIITD
ncbi:MAG TPA: hypothetical protein PKW49_03435 [Paludibacteraceae bacterium]|jgi:hypothetical protein|nr:hypothetical protein [Paludibacteraceae bacterium]